MTDLAAAIDDLLAADLSDSAPTEPGAGRCRDCGRRWKAGREAHCAACHRHFSSDSAFDLHQRLDHGPCEVKGEHGRVCRAVSVCSDPKRLVEIQTPEGLMWSWPRMPAEAIASRKGKP